MSKKIEDNSSYKKLKKEIEGAEALLSILNLLPVFGTNTSDVIKAFEPLGDLKKQFEMISKAPDKFNQHFAEKGWIAHESMNQDLMFSCIKLAEKGQIDKAEQELIDYYSSDKMKWLKHQFKGLDVFHKRYELINLAYDDTIAERYHACIPVLLMVIDGGVNDTDKTTGFFADRTDVTAWDSIAGHSNGLAILKEIFNDSRKRTTEEEISMPYRHGILHGRDINYANKTVAAKCWAMLFAICDWARALRDGKKEAPKPELELSFSETLSRLSDSANDYLLQKERHSIIDKKIELWKPRALKIGMDIPEKGQPTDYTDYTPEQEAIRFVDYWTKKNYGAIAKQIHQFSQDGFNIKIEAGKVRKVFENKTLLEHKIIKVVDCSPAISEVTLSISFKYLDQQYDKQYSLRFIYQGADGEMLIMGETGGQWKFIENFFHRIEHNY